MLDFGYVSIDGSPPDLDALALASVLAFDTETSGVNVAKDFPYGYSLAAEPNSAVYTNMQNRFFADLLADEKILKVTHNGKFDRSMVKKFGITINNVCCTMVAAHLLEETGLSLEALLKRKIKGHDLNIKFFKEFNKPIKHATLQEMANHFGPHSAATLALWNVLQKELRANMLERVFWNVEVPLLPVLSDMELDGAMIDTAKLEQLGVYYDDKIAVLGEGLAWQSGHSDMNWNSNQQVSRYLYKELGVPKPGPYHSELMGHNQPPIMIDPEKEDYPSVDKKVLEPYRSRFPIINLYLAWKSYRHLKDTYVTGIQKRLVKGRIHTNFNQTRTRTGRLSSSDPNLQNIPMRASEGKKIRQCFVAPEGKLIVKVDMDQVELRKMACLSNCKALIDAFLEGRDPHRETAIRAYGDPDRRADGKTLNFKLIYGGGTKEEQDILFKAYPEVKIWTDGRLEDYKILGYARTHHGRRRHLGDFETMSRKEVAHAHREGISTEDQGSCAEYLKISMRKIWNETHDTDIKMLLQVHDELLFECPVLKLRDLKDILQRNMTYRELQVPLTATISIGDNWANTVEIGGKK